MSNSEPRIADFKFTFESPGLTPLLQEVVCESYMPEESVLTPFEQLAHEHGLSYEDLISCTDIELLALIDSGAIPVNVGERKKGYGYVAVGGNIEILLGEELCREMAIHKVHIDKTAEIRGTVAYRGVVRGVVRIVQSPQDTAKIHDGDILVASETLPDYIMAMREAAAFVTNQGGITSHAALTAREMKKPCIVGTKFATQILKDGDMVEVDANKGVVRVLNK